MPTTCLSTNWNDIIKVTAYPDSAVSFNTPFNVEKIIVTPYVNDQTSWDYKIPESNKGIVLSISDMDASLKDESKRGVAGISHTVKLEYTMLCDANKLSDYQSELTALEAPATNYHLLVEYLGGNKHFIRSTRDGYAFDWKVGDSGKTSCSITINNVSGPQKVQ